MVLDKGGKWNMHMPVHALKYKYYVGFKSTQNRSYCICKEWHGRQWQVTKAECTVVFG